jgi:membrane protein YdbS with pleckstrin-like domain
VPFPIKLLQEGEELVLDLRPHWWAITPPAAGLAGAVALGIVALVVDNGALKFLAGIVLLVALVYFAFRYARWASTNFAVTSERVVYRQGIVARRATQMPLEKINTVDFRQSVFERLIGAGDLIIESGSDTGVATFSDVRKPLAVQQEINRQVDRHEKGGWAHPAAQAATFAPSPGPGTIPDQIAQLAALRDRGVLSEDEFQMKKAQLLDRL